MAQLTTSARGVILQNQLSTVVNLPVPGCRAGEDFLVKGIHVGPEASVGNTNVDVVHLPRWAVEVPVYQGAAGGTTQLLVPLVGIGQGAEHVNVALPAGQGLLSPQPAAVEVKISLLGGTPAQRRFEFNVHLWGECGKRWISP